MEKTHQVTRLYIRESIVGQMWQWNDCVRETRILTLPALEPVHFRKVLALSQPNTLLSAKYLVSFTFKVSQCHSKLVKKLSECQTAWIQMRRCVTWRLIRIQAICIWHHGCAWRARGKALSITGCSYVEAKRHLPQHHFQKNSWVQTKMTGNFIFFTPILEKKQVQHHFLAYLILYLHVIEYWSSKPV